MKAQTNEETGPLVVAVVRGGVEYPIKPEEQYTVHQQRTFESDERAKEVRSSKMKKIADIINDDRQ